MAGKARWSIPAFQMGEMIKETCLKSRSEQVTESGLVSWLPGSQVCVFVLFWFICYFVSYHFTLLIMTKIF